MLTVTSINNNANSVRVYDHRKKYNKRDLLAYAYNVNNAKYADISVNLGKSTLTHKIHNKAAVIAHKRPEKHYTKIALFDMITPEAIESLIQNNDALYNTLYECALDIASFWLNEYLNNCPARYNINAYGYSEFRILEDKTEYSRSTIDYRFYNFEKWLDRVQHEYCLLSDTEEKIAREFLKTSEVLRHVFFECEAKQKDIDNVYDRYVTLKKNTENIIIDRLVLEYNCIDIECLCDALCCNIDSYIYDISMNELRKAANI